MNEAGALYFPIRLRCAAVSDLLGSAALEEAIVRALGRCFAGARRALPASVAVGGGVALQPPYLTGGDLPAGDAVRLLGCVQRAIAAAARNARVFGLVPPPARAPAVPPYEVGETIDADRLVSAGTAYLIPSYQTAKDRKTAAVTVTGSRQSGGLSDEQRRLVRSTVAQLDTDEGTLFQHVLGGTRSGPGRSAPDPLNLEVLRVFARENPARFRKLLLEAVTGSAPAIARVYELDEDALKILTEDKQATAAAKRRLDVVADAIHLAGDLPDAAWLTGELERRAPGFRRIFALLGPLADAQQRLFDYLSRAEPKTDKQTLGLLDPDLWRGAALAATLAGRGRGGSTYHTQEEYLTYYRVLVTLLPKFQEIDSWLFLFGLGNGPAAGSTEEVQVLKEARSKYLDLVIDAVPGAPYRKRPIGPRMQAADKFYADWQGLAADRKLQHASEGIKQLLDNVTYMPLYAAFPGRANEYTYFNSTLIELRQKVGALSGAVGNAKQTRGEPYRQLVARLRQQIGELEVKYSLLTFWKGALDPPKFAVDHDIGDADQHAEWWASADPVLRAVQGQYPAPNYASLPDKMKDWQQALNQLVKAINDEIEAEVRRNKRKFWITLGITVVAMALTWGVAGLAEGALGLSATTTTLVGAGAFTVATTLGEVFILHEQVGALDIVVSFAENAAFGFLFKWLNVRFVAFGRSLAPGRDLAQLSIVLGADAAVGTGVNLGLSLIQTGHLPEDMQSFILSSVVLAAAGAALGGPRLRAQLQKLNIQGEFLARLDRLRQEGAAIFEDMRKIGPPGPDEAQHGALKERLLRVLPDLKEALERLAGPGFSDADLNSLGLSRQWVNGLANIVGQYFDIVRGSQWSAPAGQPGTRGSAGARALPAPPSVIPGLVPVGGGAFEYIPDPDVPAQSAERMTLLLGRSGYHVTDTGGGVLRLTGQGLDRPLLLLPGRPSVPPPSLARIVGGYGLAAQRRGVIVLEAQPDAAGYVDQLAAVAKASPENAQRLLRAVGRFLGPQHTAELQGLSRFLEVGRASVLARALSPGDTGEWFIDVQQMLRAMRTFSPQAARGLEIFFNLRPDLTAARVLRMFHNFEPQQVVGILESIAQLAPHSSDLGKLVGDLTGDVWQKYKAVVDVLTSANHDLARFPDAHFVFEDPALTPAGRKRISDYSVFRPSAVRRRVEVKAVYELKSLGREAVSQLAANILIEVAERRTLTGLGRSRPFESIDWRIRGREIIAAAADRLNLKNVDDPAIKRAAIEDVRGRLRPAFEDKAIKAALRNGDITSAELAEYRAAFESDPPFFTLF
jgi:hypothetical protein